MTKLSKMSLDTISALDLISQRPIADSTVYYIKNKDTILGSFVWETADDARLVESGGLPFFIKKRFQKWIENRTPPKHRAHMERLLDIMQLHSLRSIIDYSKGLSLTDTLWVTTDTSLKWENVSLFRNPFDETIAKIAFDGGMYGRIFSTTSPEFGTDGMLPKCWIRRDGGTYLIKGGLTGGYNTGHEPCAEVMSHQVLSRLGYNHVPYTMETRKRYTKDKTERYAVSCCPLFTSEEVMLVPSHVYLEFEQYDELLVACDRAGILRDLSEMLIFDYLSLNNDRHAGNIGILLDANTFEFLGMAPLFDNGYGMLAQWMPDMTYEYYEKPRVPKLYSTFERGAQDAKKYLRHQHNVEALINFTIDRSQILLETEERIDGIEKWFRKRVEKFLKM